MEQESHDVVFVNKAAKALGKNFSWDYGKQGSTSPLVSEAFAHLDKRVLMQNLDEMESTFEKLQNLDDYKSI